MIPSTKKHLTLIFFSIIIAFNILLLAISYFSMHQSIIRSIRYHVSHDDKKEFKSSFFFSDVDSFKKITDDELFHVLDEKGVAITTYYSKDFNAQFNAELYHAAKNGEETFETVEIEGIRYLLFYFPLTDEYVGRIAEPLIQLMEYEYNFLILTVILFPGMLLVSFFISKYLVNQAMIPITEAFRFQENFSSNVSHELQTPLASLKGNLEVSLRKPRENQEYKEVIELGLGETNRIITLLKDLYLLASSGFKSLSLYYERTEIDELLIGIKSRFQQRIEEKSLKIEDNSIEQSPCVCDKALIERALENLYDNAIKYTPEGGRIQISCERSKDFIRVSFENQSQPLEPNEIKSLKDPFVRGKNAEDAFVDGKGLGLNIANYIVRSHKGTMRIEMNEKDRFLVRITLPVGKEKRRTTS